MEEHWGQAEDTDDQFFTSHFEEKAEIKRDRETFKIKGVVVTGLRESNAALQFRL